MELEGQHQHEEYDLPESEEDDAMADEILYGNYKEEACYPPYWFMTRKLKKKFFNKLNNTFTDMLQEHKIKKPNGSSSI